MFTFDCVRGSNPHENDDTELGVNIPARPSFAPPSRPSQPARMSAFASTPVHNPTVGAYDNLASPDHGHSTKNFI